MHCIPEVRSGIGVGLGPTQLGVKGPQYVQWEGEGFPGHVAVAIGSFADPNFPAPTIAVWEESRHPWVSLPPDTPPKRVPKQG